jgi:hypothetical protein
MKVKIELEIDLGDDFIDSSDEKQRDWLLNDILTTDNLELRDHFEVGDVIGKIIKVSERKITEF